MGFESYADLERDLLESLDEQTVENIMMIIKDGEISKFEKDVYEKIMNTISTDPDWLATKKSTDPNYTSDNEILNDVHIICILEQNGVSSNDLLNDIQNIPEIDNNCYFLIESTLRNSNS